jgi:hypothetical protein
MAAMARTEGMHLATLEEIFMMYNLVTVVVVVTAAAVPVQASAHMAAMAVQAVPVAQVCPTL